MFFEDFERILKQSYGEQSSILSAMYVSFFLDKSLNLYLLSLYQSLYIRLLYLVSPMDGDGEL